MTAKGASNAITPTSIMDLNLTEISEKLLRDTDLVHFVPSSCLKVKRDYDNEAMFYIKFLSTFRLSN